MDTRDWGRMLDETDIKAGLRLLQPGIHFDMATCIGQWHPMQAVRQGVYYDGTHITSMDRGQIPEFKVWDVKEHTVNVSINEMDRDDVTLRYQTIPRSDPAYADLLSEVRRGRHADCFVRMDGAIVKLCPVRTVKIKNRVVMVGWRHTFEGILKDQVPGITREGLARQFGVDMYKFPVGAPDEVHAALTAE